MTALAYSPCETISALNIDMRIVLEPADPAGVGWTEEDAEAPYFTLEPSLRWKPCH